MLMDESASPAPAPVPAAISAAVAPCVNLADFQNSVPAIRELSVTNTGSERLNDLDLALHSEPPFIKTRVWHIESIDPGQTVQVSDLDTKLDGALLARLTEAEKATVRFTVVRRTVSSIVIGDFETVTELLPRNQWGGIGQLPEMIAAFVQPNDPAVERLLKGATRILEGAGRSPSIDGYQQGAKRAWELTSALWSAVTALGLDYSLPPASFEQTGQKIRGTSQVVDSGLATCLDLALLFASCLEQAHLNPLLVFLKQHVFAGVWLRSEEFSTPVVDDVTALRKRVQLQDLLLFETTLATHRPPTSFLRACDHAAQQIAEAATAPFELAVDVRRARLNRIKPLASADAVVARVTDAAQTATAATFVEAPDLPDEEGPTVPVVPSDPTDRLARWRRKLLDLSLRNNLLNFRESKKAIPLVAPEPGRLEDLLADGQSLKLLPQPPIMQGDDPRSRLVHESRDQEDVGRQHALDALTKREVFVPLSAEDMDVRLTELYRAARGAMQEGGGKHAVPRTRLFDVEPR